MSGETGVFGGFKVLDGGSTVGGGFVSGWVCSESQSRYALTVTGPQALSLIHISEPTRPERIGV